MSAAGCIDFAERRGGLCNRLGRATRERFVPVADGIRNERLESEGLSVAAGAIAAAFPKAVNELRQRIDPFVRAGVTKGRMEFLSLLHSCLRLSATQGSSPILSQRLRNLLTDLLTDEPSAGDIR